MVRIGGRERDNHEKNSYQHVCVSGLQLSDAPTNRSNPSNSLVVAHHHLHHEGKISTESCATEKPPEADFNLQGTQQQLEDNGDSDDKRSRE